MSQAEGQGFKFALGQLEFLADFYCVNFNARQMFVCGLVLRFNRQCQRLDGAAMEGCHFLRVIALLLGSPLFFLQAIHVQAMRPVNHVQNWQ